MTVNNTCVTGGEDCSPSGSQVALPASLTVVFLLLVVIAGIIAYKFRSKLRNRLQFGERRSQTKKEEDCAEAIPVARHQYRPTGMSRDESTGQTPIYENMIAQGAKYNKCRVNQSRYVTREVLQALTGSLCFLGLCVSI